MVLTLDGMAPDVAVRFENLEECASDDEAPVDDEPPEAPVGPTCLHAYLHTCMHAWPPGEPVGPAISHRTTDLRPPTSDLTSDLSPPTSHLSPLTSHLLTS